MEFALEFGGTFIQNVSIMLLVCIVEALAMIIGGVVLLGTCYGLGALVKWAKGEV